AALVAACDTTPAPPPVPSPAPSSSATLARTKPSSRPQRCLEPTPPVPARPAPPPGPDPSCPEDPDGRPELPRGQVRFDGERVVEVEIAEEHKWRMRGLMYRRELPENEGMLFAFPRPQRLSFWMRNTCLPLDMLFIDAEGVVVTIQENVPTMNDKTYRTRCLAKYVLEVNAGWARRHGVKAGDKVVMEGLKNEPRRRPR
ncbi:MAG: DUF192 domain-containing protein, partial [Myxococcota bacterium]